MARVTVLGGGGFIGSNLCSHLHREGHEVTAVDVHFPFFRHAPLEGVRKWRADLTDPHMASLSVEKADVVFHLAADMGGVAWFHSPKDWQASITNGIITANVLAACTRQDVPRLVYTSSACAYATEPQHIPGKAPKLDEDSGLLVWGTPDAGYGAEKRYGLQLCGKAPFDARVAICHTIFGPYQEHEGQRMKFPAAVATKAIRARETGVLELWGDGRQMRSYLYIDDAVQRLRRLGFDDRYDGPVNVGATGAVSCRQVAEMCLRLAGADAEIVTVEGPVGVMSRDCDNTKWERTYGPARETPLEDAFGEFIDWLDRLPPTTATRTPPDRAVRPAPERR